MLLTEMIDSPRADANLLYHADWEHSLLFVQSDIEPAENQNLKLMKTVDLDSVRDSIKNGKPVTFFWTSNPHKKKRTSRDGKRRVKYLTRPDDVLDWIVRTLDRHGLHAEDVRILGNEHQHIQHDERKGSRASVTLTDFKVRGVVEDADAFKKAWHQGIGNHRAYGGGMLMLVQ